MGGFMDAILHGFPGSPTRTRYNQQLQQQQDIQQKQNDLHMAMINSGAVPLVPGTDMVRRQHHAPGVDEGPDVGYGDGGGGTYLDKADPSRVITHKLPGSKEAIRYEVLTPEAQHLHDNMMKVQDVAQTAAARKQLADEAASGVQQTTAAGIRGTEQGYSQADKDYPMTGSQLGIGGGPQPAAAPAPAAPPTIPAGAAHPGLRNALQQYLPGISGLSGTPSTTGDVNMGTPTSSPALNDHLPGMGPPVGPTSAAGPAPSNAASREAPPSVNDADISTAGPDGRRILNPVLSEPPAVPEQAHSIGNWARIQALQHSQQLQRQAQFTADEQMKVAAAKEFSGVSDQAGLDQANKHFPDAGLPKVFNSNTRDSWIRSYGVPIEQQPAYDLKVRQLKAAQNANPQTVANKVNGLADPNRYPEINARGQFRLQQSLNDGEPEEKQAKILDEIDAEVRDRAKATDPQIAAFKIKEDRDREAALSGLKVQQAVAIQKATRVGENPAVANVAPAAVEGVQNKAMKLDSDYIAAKASADDIDKLLTLAEQGNKAAGANVPLLGVAAINAVNGIKRMNSAEISQYGTAGSLLDKIQGKLQGWTEGQPIPKDVLEDARTLHGMLTETAYKKYIDGLGALNNRSGSTYKPGMPPPAARAAPATTAAPQHKVGDTVQYQGTPHKIKEIKANGKLVLEL